MPLDLHLLHATLLFAAPLLIAAAGELIVQRSGIVNIGIEGMMLSGALGAWLGNLLLGPVAGVAAGVLAGCILGLLFAVAVVPVGADQIVSGAAINLLALGATGAVAGRFHGTLDQLAARPLSPWWLIVAAIVLPGMLWAWLRLTRAGLELTALGEAPEAADSAGIRVHRQRFAAVLFGAACAGLAGGYLSTMRVAGFTENMTEGQGFLALALVIFGRWTAPGILLAGVFFGLVRALANRLNVYEATAGFNSLLDMLPYVVSILALAGLAGRSRAPAALGKPYVREA